MAKLISLNDLPPSFLDTVKLSGLNTDYYNAWFAASLNFKATGHFENIPHYQEYFDSTWDPPSVKKIMTASDPQKVSALDSIVDEFNGLSNKTWDEFCRLHDQVRMLMNI